MEAYVASFVATWRQLGMPGEKVSVEDLGLTRKPATRKVPLQAWLTQQG